MRQWQQALQAEQIMDAGPKRVSPLSAFQINETKEGGMIVITTTQVTQMYDILKTLQAVTDQKALKKSFGVKARGWEKSLRKHGKIIMKYRVTRPIQHVVTISVEAKTLCATSATLPSTSPSSPLHALFTPSTPGSHVPGVDSPCSPLHQVRGCVSPSTGNASKTRPSLPQVNVEQNRRELVAFCQQCWQFSNFRHNKGEIGILPLMVKLLIDTYRTAEYQPGCLRGERTSHWQKIKKYVGMCLKTGKGTGPARCPNKLTNMMTDEEFQIMKMWMN